MVPQKVGQQALYHWLRQLPFQVVFSTWRFEQGDFLESFCSTYLLGTSSKKYIVYQYLPAGRGGILSQVFLQNKQNVNPVHG